MNPAAESSLDLNRVGAIGYRTFADAGGRLLAFALVVLAARFLSTPEFGLFSLAWTSGWLISIAADFGLQIHLTREVAQNPPSAGAVLRQLLKVRLGLAAALGLSTAAALWWLSPGSFLPMLAIVSAHLVTNLVDFFNHFFRGLQLSHWEASVNLLQRGLALALGTALLVQGYTLEALAWALQLSAWTALAVAVRLAWSRVGRRSAWTASPPLDSHWERVWPIGLGILLSALYFRLDLFVLESFRGTEEVGLYNAVFRLVDAARLFPAAALAVVFPLLCRPGRARVFRQTLTGLLALGAAGALVGWWVAPPIVQWLYGSRFAASVPVLQLLLLSLPLLFLNFLLTHQLLAEGLQRAYAWVCAGGLAAAAIGSLLLIPENGMAGAAWACLVREGLISAACCWILFSLKRSLFE